MTKITYGAFETEIEALPAASIVALVKRGLSHYMGNEQAAKVSAVKSARKDSGEPELSPDEISAMLAERRKSAWDVLLAGTIGAQRAAGPRASVDPLEAMKHRVAREQVVERLRQAGLKTPKGDATVKFANGVEKTMADMIAKRLEVDADGIEKEAKKRLAEAKRRQDAIAKQAAGVDGEAPDELGL